VIDSRNKRTHLPYGRQVIEDDDVEAVVKVLRGDWLTTGPNVDAFEAALAARVGAKYAVSCSSGTAALHMVAMAMGLGPNDVAVVPSLTFAATANAAFYVGADVIFADVDPDTGLMTGESLQEALERGRGRNIRAVFPVHLNGQCADPEEISRIANKAGLQVIEDACHALGSSYQVSDGAVALAGECRHCDAAVFSFHPVKTIAVGEGGAVTTNDEALNARMRRLRSHGLTRAAADFTNHDLAFASDGTANPWYYEVAELGYNFRLSDISCAMGLSQLRKVDRFIARRQDLVRQYREGLRNLAPLVRPVEQKADNSAAWHIFPVLIDFDRLGCERGQLMEKLRDRGIGTQVHYIPLHLQPFYQNRVGDQSRLAGAEAYYQKVLSLPLFPSLSDDDVTYVVENLHDIVQNS
jgi:UDP-4-amino-4,6-dideoxy-N-acetyl-beta-L-altrosamine transaminase